MEYDTTGWGNRQRAAVEPRNWVFVKNPVSLLIPSSFHLIEDYLRDYRLILARFDKSTVRFTGGEQGLHVVRPGKCAPFVARYPDRALLG